VARWAAFCRRRFDRRLILKEHLMPSIPAIAAGLTGFIFGNFLERDVRTADDSGIRELSMSSTDGEIGMRDLSDKATQQRLEERLEKDVAAVKNDIAALTTRSRRAQYFAGAKKQARRGYKQARENVDAPSTT